MSEIIAKIYGWFGLIPLYSKDLDEHLKGLDIESCGFYVENPWYLIIFFLMIFSIIIVFLLHYQILPILNYRLNRVRHWWMFALFLSFINAISAFLIIYDNWQAVNYCSQLQINLSSILGFGFSNAIWSFLLYTILTSLPYPRKLTNASMNYLTFWNGTNKEKGKE